MLYTTPVIPSVIPSSALPLDVYEIFMHFKTKTTTKQITGQWQLDACMKTHFYSHNILQKQISTFLNWILREATVSTNNVLKKSNGFNSDYHIELLTIDIIPIHHYRTPGVALDP